MRRLPCIGSLILLASSFALVLSSCAHVEKDRMLPADLEQQWQKQTGLLSTINEWQLSGRISVKNNQQSWQGGLRWYQHDTAFEISFSGFLGQQAAKLVGDSSGVKLIRPKEADLFSSDVSALLGEHFGWSIPVEGLRYWILGLPDPGVKRESMLLNAMGLLASLEQAGWVVRFEKYQRVDDIYLPRKIKMTHARINIRVLMDEWSLQQSVKELMKAVPKENG